MSVLIQPRRLCARQRRFDDQFVGKTTTVTLERRRNRGPFYLLRWIIHVAHTSFCRGNSALTRIPFFLETPGDIIGFQLNRTDNGGQTIHDSCAHDQPDSLGSYAMYLAHTIACRKIFGSNDGNERFLTFTRVQMKWRRETVNGKRIPYSKTLVYGNGKAKYSQYYHNRINRHRKKFDYYKLKKKMFLNSVWKKFLFITKFHIVVFIIFSIYKQSLNKNIVSNVY